MSNTKSQKSTRTVSRGGLIAALLVIVALAAGAIVLNQRPAEAADIVVYKSPTCGCCGKWVDHLRANGFSVSVRERGNLQPIKDKLGVPRRMRSCHTAEIGGYTIEGHVPADVISRLLKEKPPIKGLAVPGMPMGSPGMEGPRRDAYDVLAFRKSGATMVYASR